MAMEGCMYSSIKFRRSSSSIGEEKMDSEDMPIISLCSGTRNKENINKRYHKRPRSEYKSPHRVTVKYPLVVNGENKIRKNNIAEGKPTETLIQKEINEKNRKIDMKNNNKTRQMEMPRTKNSKLLKGSTSGHQKKVLHEKMRQKNVGKRISGNLKMPITNYSSVEEYFSAESDEDEWLFQDPKKPNLSFPKSDTKLQNDDVLFVVSSSENVNKDIPHVNEIYNKLLPNKNATTTKSSDITVANFATCEHSTPQKDYSTIAPKIAIEELFTRIMMLEEKVNKLHICSIASDLSQTSNDASYTSEANIISAICLEQDAEYGLPFLNYGGQLGATSSNTSFVSASTNEQNFFTNSKSTMGLDPTHNTQLDFSKVSEQQQHASSNSTTSNPICRPNVGGEYCDAQATHTNKEQCVLNQNDNIVAATATEYSSHETDNYDNLTNMMELSNYDFNCDEIFDGINDISLTDQHTVIEEFTKMDNNELSNTDTLGYKRQMIAMIDALLESNGKLTDILGSIDDQSGGVTREMATDNNRQISEASCADEQSTVWQSQIIGEIRNMAEHKNYDQCSKSYSDDNEDIDLVMASKSEIISKTMTSGNQTHKLDEGDQPVQGICIFEVNKVSEKTEIGQDSPRELFSLSNDGISVIATTSEFGPTSPNKRIDVSDKITRNMINEKTINNYVTNCANKVDFACISSDNNDSYLNTACQAKHQVDTDSEIEILSETNNTIDKTTTMCSKKTFFSTKERISKKFNDTPIENTIIFPLAKKRRQKTKTFWQKHSLK